MTHVKNSLLYHRQQTTWTTDVWTTEPNRQNFATAG